MSTTSSGTILTPSLLAFNQSSKTHGRLGVAGQIGGCQSTEFFVEHDYLYLPNFGMHTSPVFSCSH